MVPLKESLKEPFVGTLKGIFKGACSGTWTLRTGLEVFQALKLRIFRSLQLSNIGASIIRIGVLVFL